MTPQLKTLATPGAYLSTRVNRGDRRSRAQPAVFGLKSSYRLSTVCAAAGVLMVIGGVAGNSRAHTLHSQPAAPTTVATASAGEPLQIPLKKVGQSQPIAAQLIEIHQHIAAQPPAAPKPIKPQKSQKPQQSQAASQQANNGGAGFYKNCPEARTPGPTPVSNGESGHYSALDRNNDGKLCED